LPNGFMGSKEEWRRMEAPYVRIDPILAAFAQRHRLELYRNYRDADRSLRFNDDLSRTIWIQATDTYGTNGTYRITIIAYQDRPKRYLKGEGIADAVTIPELDSILEQAVKQILSWTAADLELANYKK
jgi:hypothetical protein